MRLNYSRQNMFDFRKFIQVVGNVTGKDRIEALSIQHQDPAANFDLELYNKALELIQGKYNYLFE